MCTDKENTFLYIFNIIKNTETEKADVEIKFYVINENRARER